MSAERDGLMHAVRSMGPAIVAHRERMGFVAATWGTFPVRLMAAEAELVELEQALRRVGLTAGARNEVRDELADVCMYQVTLLEDFEEYGCRTVAPIVVVQPPGELTAPIRREHRRAYEHWRLDQRKDAVISVSLALLNTLRLAQGLGWGAELPAFIQSKMRRNLERPARNGGKRAES